jgi:hypothetical protein
MEERTMQMRSVARAIVAAALVVLAGSSAGAQENAAAATTLTIYNQDFALARSSVELNLNAGTTEVTTTNVTRQMEPDSVVLRDPAGKVPFKVVEQNYDASIVTQEWMLRKFEGKTIDFETLGFNLQTGAQTSQTVQGKIVRADNPPLIEVNGKMQFQLPGTPLFPAATDGLLLKPTLRWQIYSAKAAKVTAELAYITHGMSWQATYNVVAPESKDVTGSERGDVIGWITIKNDTGTDFPEARIKLMAGDVAKLRNYGVGGGDGYGGGMYTVAGAMAQAPAPVTQQAFDDFHLYDLNRNVTMRTGETKQVQFMQAADVTMTRVYEYDGSGFSAMGNYGDTWHQSDAGWSLGSKNKKVGVRIEVKNAEANHMGMPLPAGRVRVYRRDGANMEFVGETMIDHTPAEEALKLQIGSAFDVTGERKQMDFHVDSRAHTMDESFEITVKNQKATPVDVAVVEHLNRSMNWQVTEKSDAYNKRDSSTVEYPLNVPAHGERKLTYTAHYSW